MMNRTLAVRVRLLAGLLFALLALFVALPQGAFAVGPVIGEDHPTEPGEVMLFKEAAPVPGLVNTWGVTLRVEAMDVKQTADIVLVIDRSGSMRGTRLASAKAAAAEFAGTLLTPENAALPADDPGKVRVAVVSFAGDVSTDQQLTDNQAAVLSAINGINADGGTFTQAGLRTAAGLLNTTADFKNLVLLSDGEPTYSYSIDYDWRMNTANLIAGGHPAGGYSTPTTVPASMFGTDRVGSGSSIWQRYDNPWYSENDKYYNHGNSAIAQSRYFKDDGQNKFIYTIALETEEVGDQVLNGIASGGKAYTGSSADLANIFQDIAGRIKSNVQEATVGDPLGMGFVVEGTVGHIEVTPGTTATYDSAAKEITWEIGTLSAALPNPEPINPNLVGIKYAEMTYQIEVDDDILGAQEGEGGTYSTNGQAVLTYTDAQGEPQEIIFPKPQVDPILLILEKKLYNSLGAEITTQADAADNRQFDIRITSDKGYDQTYRLYAGQRRVMTNLRLEDTYTVAEQPVIVGTPASVMGDYADVVYNVYDEDKSVFVINQGDPDSPVLVTNRELPLGKLTIEKVFIPQAAGGEPTGGTTPGTDAPAFTFTVTGPTGPHYPAPHQYTFTLQAGKAHTIDNLPYGEYTVVETVPEGFAVTYSDSDEYPGSSTTDGKVRLSIDHKEGTITATNRPTADNQYTGAIGYKQWVNGPAQDHVPVAMQLFADGQLYTPATPYTVSPPAGPAATFTYTWQNLPKYNQYGQAITYTIDEESTPAKYTNAVSDDGLTVTNTYTPDADATATANKLWVDGPANKPTVWFQLWRNVAGGTPEVVPGAQVKELTGGTIGAGGTAITSVSWSDLVAENDDGLQYVFSVKELDGLDGAVNPPAGYLASGGTGSAAARTITNTYQIIKDAETATKVWVNGPTPRPTVWFRLYRAIGTAAAQPVPGAAIQKLEDGTTSVTWQNIDQTDSSGNEYTFTVREVDAEGNLSFTPKDYSKKEVGLTVTNTYVPPLIEELPATKAWVYGPVDNRPTIGFKLYRHLTGAAEDPDADAVSSATVLELPNGVTEVEWTNLPKTDDNGVEYIYYIREVTRNTEGAYVVGPPANYSVAYDGLKATDTYQIPTQGEATATKTWVDGPATKPTVWFQLWRKTTTGTPEIDQAVPDMEIKELPNGTLSVAWDTLEQTDILGRSYTFYVVEGQIVNGKFTPVAPENHVQSGKNTLNITNEYVSPPMDVQAVKVWQGEPAGKRVPVQFQLYRQVDGGEAEAEGLPVTLKGVAETLADGTGESPAWTYNWGGLPKTDDDGAAYTYFVREVAVPGNYAADDTDDLTVTNAWQVLPDVTATKQWEDAEGQAIDPPQGGSVTLVLSRSSVTTAKETVATVVLNGQADGAGTEPPLTADGSGELTPWVYTWKGLPQKDGANNDYIYTVQETARPTSFAVAVTPDPDNPNGFIVTNTFQGTQVVARKVYEGEPAFGGHPNVTFHLYQDGTELTDMQAVLTGEVAGNENPAWTYTWSNLPKYSDNGSEGVPPTEHEYTVKETIPSGYVMTSSVVDENGVTVITNTVNDGTFSAEKKWVPADSAPVNTVGQENPVTITWALHQRIVNDTATTPYDMVVDTVVLDGLIDEDKDFTTENGEYAPWKYIWRGLEGNREIDGTTVTFWYEIKEIAPYPDGFAYDTTSKASMVATNYSLLTDFTATKKWVNGPKPDVTLELWRTWTGAAEDELFATVTLTGEGTGDGTTTGELPPTDANTWHYKWVGLDRYHNPETMPPSEEYIYYIVEQPLTDYPNPVYEPATYPHTVTNTYAIPTTSFTAEKSWVNGDHKRPAVWFRLYRQIGETGTRTLVPNTATPPVNDGRPTQVPAAEPFTVTWTGLDKTDINGIPYIFSVEEGLWDGTTFTVGPPNDAYKVKYIAPTDEAPAYTVENTYYAYGDWTPEVFKRLDGRNLAAGEFSFTLTAAEGSPLYDANGALINVLPASLTAANGAPGELDPHYAAAEFPIQHYTQADIGKTYTYTITETVPTPGLGGVTYADLVITATVVITDNGEGNLGIEITYAYKNTAGETVADTGLVFNNLYKSAASVQLGASKRLIGRALGADEFSFTLAAVAGAPMKDADGNDIAAGLTQANGAPDADTGLGTVTFPALHFTQADAGKAYQYTITEVKPIPGLGGVTYSDLLITATVTLTDDGVGNLSPSVTYAYTNAAGEPVEPTNLIFANTYEGDTSAILSAGKTLEGREFEAGEFSFTLASVGTAPMNDVNGDAIEATLLTQTNGEPNAEGVGAFTFPTLYFTEDDIGLTHQYTIKEVTTPALGGVTYDDLIITASVAVTYNEADETLSTSVAYTYTNAQGDPIEREAPIFNNLYEATGAFTPTVYKALNGRELAVGEFSFTLTANDGAPTNDENGNPIADADLTQVNGAPDADTGLGTVTFPALHFTLDNVGTYVYSIEEIEPDPRLLGVTYDKTSIDLTLIISDNGDGTLVFESSYSVEDARFVNTFADPSAVVELVGDKELSGLTLSDKAFSFQLLDSEDNVLQTVPNSADGTVAFNPVMFAAAGEGYILKVREVAGSDSLITYDGTVYTLTFDVTVDVENNVLVAKLVKLARNGTELEDLGTPLAFRNVYTPPEPTPEPDPLYPTLRVPLKAGKTLKNATLTAGQFTFQLKDARGTVLAEAQNAADGSITFPDRTFRREVSNYIFTINEKPGNDKAIAYDATVYTIKVTTTARDDKLRARVNVERDGVPYGGDIHFTNQRKMPATGDSTLWTVLSLAGVAIILTGGALVLNRRRKAQQP